MRGVALAVGLAVVPGAAADTVTLTPVADATIYSNEFQLLANGAGAGFFVGNNSAQNTRRGLVRFDLSVLPAGATVTDAVLTLHLSSSISGDREVRVHRATTAWSEGPSLPTGTGGRGTTPLPGDCTWLHTSFSSQFWATPGGDFVASPSGAATVGDDFRDYTWSGPGLAADVQAWAASPGANLGWFVLGVEEGFTAAKRFDSRENSDGSVRPRLTVTYTVGPACYANCDGSTVAPVLTVLDFNCFINRFSSGDSYANCDGSTIPPVLNVLDFNCFINRFSQGCP
jgi:hypothetical protein